MVDLDLHVDMSNLELNKSVMCGDCMTRMEEVKPNNYKCPQCGRAYAVRR